MYMNRISMVRVNYHLTTPQVVELKNLSKEMGTTVAELIRRAVDEYIKQCAKRSRPSEVK